MEIRRLSGGKTIGIVPTESLWPEDLEPPKFRGAAPGRIEGNTAAAFLIAEAARLRNALPAVTHVRVLIRDVEDERYLLIVPHTGSGANYYKLTYKKKAPTVSGLKKLFTEAKIPLRADQWYHLTPELVEDDREGFAVACNWTRAELAVRDIARERQLHAEAGKRHRAKQKRARDE